MGGLSSWYGGTSPSSGTKVHRGASLAMRLDKRIQRASMINTRLRRVSLCHHGGVFVPDGIKIREPRKVRTNECYKNKSAADQRQGMRDSPKRFCIDCPSCGMTPAPVAVNLPLCFLYFVLSLDVFNQHMRAQKK